VAVNDYEGLRNTHPRPDYATEKRWEMESLIDRLERRLERLERTVFYVEAALAASLAIAGLGVNTTLSTRILIALVSAVFLATLVVDKMLSVDTEKNCGDDR
jgi:hypothetical protein